MTPPLVSPRLDLEPVTANHAREAWPLLDDARMWTYFTELRPATYEDLRARYRRWERGSQDPAHIWLNWLGRERSSGALAVSMQATIVPAQACAYVAYATFPEYRRRGLAAEASRCIIGYVRQAYGIDRFFAEMDERNVASYRLAERLGFARVESSGGEYRYRLDAGSER